MYVCMYVWMDGWMDGWMDVRTYMDECMYVCMDVWMDGCTYVYGCMDEWMDGSIRMPSSWQFMYHIHMDRQTHLQTG